MSLTAPVANGSPPQVRGKLLLFGIVHSFYLDHPRRCGENDPPPPKPPPKPGSPPQVRGKRKRNTSMRLRKRITPAGAGKTIVISDMRWHKKDHPRRCGENLLTYGYNSSDMGSPPQVRGKRKGDNMKISLQRITPAGAGKTDHPRLRHRRGWDHPRRCGENRVQQVRRTKGGGSPPQVRGKRPTSQKAVFDIRITPAGAGKTGYFFAFGQLSEDHPRRCGENE